MMKYWLRRVIFEDIWERQAEELVRLCGRTEIDGVLLMEQSHMALMSPYPFEKHERMAEIYGHIGKRLKDAGIHYGINIASLVGHTDMEVPEGFRLGFQPFVGDDQREALACYCILDQEWQEYASRVCKEYAGTEPECLFLDDDFRSLNHGRQLGCFCPIHVAKTSQRLRRDVTSREIIEALGGRDQGSLEIRTAWMEANYEGQREAAAKIEENVHRSFPDVRLGLMSSDELRHSLQGRPIEALLQTLAGRGKKMLYRPTGAIYGDAIHKAVFEGHQRMALTMGEIKNPVQVVSELELFPHTRFTCSRRFSEIMMKTQILAGAHDITLNLYDYLGNPVEREPIWEDMLRENKEMLSRLSRLRRGKKMKGFGLPYRMEESRYKTMKKGDPASLYPDRSLDLLLPAMGIPVQFTQAGANGLMGESVWCYGDDELMDLLSGGFLTDARGAQILWKRGFGEYLGCRPIPAGEIIPAMEKVICPEYGGAFQGDILPTRWNLFSTEDRYLLEAAPEAQTLTTLLDLEKKEVGAGAVLYENRLGGICAVMAVGPRQETWGFRAKAWLIKEIIRRLSANQLPVVISDCPNLGPIYYEDEGTGEGVLAVLNGSLDGYHYRMELNGIQLWGRGDMAAAAQAVSQAAAQAADQLKTSAPRDFNGFLEGIAMTVYMTRRAL